MIEIMLVVCIVLLLSSLAMPSFLRAWRGAELRSGVRSAVMIHRHARNLAILRQRHVAVRVDPAQQLFDVVVLPPQAGDDAADLEEWLQSTWAAESAEPAAAPPAAEAATTAAPPATVSAPDVDVRRSLPSGVRIAGVELELERTPAGPSEPVWIFYYPSGLCEAFTLRLQDESLRGATLRSDPLTGQVTVEYEGEPAKAELAPPAQTEGPCATHHNAA